MAEILNSSAAEVKTAAEQSLPETPVEAAKQETVVKVAEIDTKQATPSEKTAGKVIDISVIPDKPILEKTGAEQETTAKDDTPEIEDTREEWEKTFAEIEAEKKAQTQRNRRPKANDEKAVKPKKAVGQAKSDKSAKQTTSTQKGNTAEGKAQDKAPPATPEPNLKEKKVKLEAELREKYGIPKSDKPVKPWVAPEVEQVVRIPHDKLHSFKDHPFNVEKNTKFLAFVASIRAQGVTQPAVVRPDGKGNYELVSGHRRDAGSIEAGIPYTPCIIRGLNDDQAIQQMVEDNVNNREITTMELAKALKMQLDAIKHQGARKALDSGDFTADVGKRSNEIVAERNGMSVTNVKCLIRLNNLVKPMQDIFEKKVMNADGKAIKIGLTTATEIACIRPKNQEYLAFAIEAQQAAPKQEQAKRMKELDQKGLLNSDAIDGIMCEEKKEVDQVIITGDELREYFGNDKTPKEMKDQIIKLLDDWKGKEIAPPQKKADKEK